MIAKKVCCLIAVLGFSLTSFAQDSASGADNSNGDGQKKWHGHRHQHVDPLDGPKASDESVEVPAHGEKKLFADEKEIVKPRKVVRLQKEKTPKKSSDAEIKSQIADMPSNIVLGVPKMENSVYELAPKPVKTTRPTQFEFLVSSYQPNHFNTPTMLNNPTRFQGKGAPELSLASVQDLGIESAPFLSLQFEASYFHLQRTGVDPMPGQPLNLVQDLNMATFRTGVVNEWETRLLGTHYRPFLGGGVFVAWAQSGTGAFDNGINQFNYGLQESAGMNVHYGAWHASLGFENRNGLSTSNVDGNGFFAGLARDLE